MTQQSRAAVKWNMFRTACPTRQVLDRIANKWTMLVIMALEERTMRFNELRQHIDGVSQKMLTQTLRGMESDGFVCRTVYPTVPPSVEYSLTDLGISLARTVDVLRDWAYTHMPDIEAARHGFSDRAEAPHASPSATVTRLPAAGT